MPIATQLYRLTSPSGKQYIGVTKKPLSIRISQHISCQNLIGKALRKYGRESFNVEVLVVGDEDYIYDLEKRAVDLFKTLVPNGYNLKEGGQRGCRYTEESRRRMSESAKRSCGEIQRYVPSTTGHIYSKESRQRMSVAQKQSYGQGRVSGFTGRKHSEETKQKISEARKKYWAKKKEQEISCAD